MFAAGNEKNINEDANANNIIFTIEDTKLYVSVVTLSARDNQNLSRLFSKEFEKWVYWNEYKTKSDNENMGNKFRSFLESILFVFFEVNRLFVLFYTNKVNKTKTCNAWKFCLPKRIIQTYNVIINGNNFYNQAIDCEVKRYIEINKLTTRQGED